MPRIPGDPDQLVRAADMLERVCADLRTRAQVAARGSDVATAQWSGAGSQAFAGTSLEHTLRLDGAHRRLSRLAGSLRVQAARLRALQDDERALTRARESVLTQLQQRGPEQSAARTQDLVQLRRVELDLDEVGRRARVEGARAQLDLEGHHPAGHRMRTGPVEPGGPEPGDRMRTGPVEPVGRGPEHRMTTGPEAPVAAQEPDRMHTGPVEPVDAEPGHRMRTGPESPFPTGPTGRMQTGPESPFPPGEPDRMHTGPVGRMP